MAALMLVILLMQVAFQLINTIGASPINDFLWKIYTSLPGSSLGQKAHRQREVRRDVVKLKREMQAVSSQDEFARWAKIRRQHDKKENEYEEISQSLQQAQTHFQSYAYILRSSFTFGLRSLIIFWYGRQPMYWLPNGWVPGYIEWILAFPKAPTGSVSIVTWDLACQCVILMVRSAVLAVWLLVYGGEANEKQQKEQIGVPGRGTEGKKKI